MHLKRYPVHKNETLQAWDSADELMLEHVREAGARDKRVVILDDRFGALSCGLEDGDVTTYTDSFVSAKAITINSEGRRQTIHDLGKLEGVYDLALVRIPKNMSFFEDLLCHLSAHLGAESKVVCGYMVKHQAKASFELLNKYIGTTSTSLAQKKARLIFADFEKSKASSPYPIEVPIDGFEKPFTNHSNLFSREKLDIGTRFLLEHIPQGDAILDLGCGNGVVGIAAKKENPDARIVFSDDSWLALESARINYGKFFDDQAEFVWTNCYEDQKPASVDLVLCNPPFHQGNTLGDFIAWQMFTDARDRKHASQVSGRAQKNLRQ
jgi:23S rRNA (guanine1835-N2)-methyltransferase